MFVEEKIEDGVTTWTISRPERLNTLGTSIAGELAQKIITSSNTLAAAKAFVLRAAPCQTKSGRIWIAGGDLKELAQIDRCDAYAKTMADVCYKIANLPVPVITVIEGAAIGGGAELALLGDIRMASDDYALDFRQLDVGLATGYGSAKRLVDLIGKAHAQKVLYLPEPVKGERGVDLGLVHKLVGRDSLPEALASCIRHIKTFHPASFSAQKAMLHSATFAKDPQASQKQELQAFTRLWGNTVHERVLSKFRNSE